MTLFPGERIDYVNDSLSLIQKPEGLTFGTDALLLAGYVSGKHKNGYELGAGSGIISMLLLTRAKLARVTALEVQEDYAELTRRNAELNGLEDRLIPLCADLRDVKGDGTADLVFTNPPYMRTDSGRANVTDAKNVARHEVFGDIGDFCEGAKRLLKFGGSFYAVYRTDRLCDLIFEMRRCGIEPKRITFVHASVEAEPSMVLVEGRLGGKAGLFLTKPLIIYKDKTNAEYGDDMNYIMEHGSFPDEFVKR